MYERFRTFADALHPKFEALMATQPSSDGLNAGIRGSGIYLFTEAGRHLYVGRTRNVRGRYGQHSRPSAKHNDAPFAFKLAREETGFLKADYRPGEGSRTGLAANTDFAEAFKGALARIRQMEFRFVNEDDPTRQCLLEVYASVVLQTPYNDFDTH